MLLPLLLHVVPLAQEGPAPEEVTAGWLGFVVFIALALALVVLGFSLVKQLRKAQAAKDAGVYGDDPVTDDEVPGGTAADGPVTEGPATDDPGPETRPHA